MQYPVHTGDLEIGSEDVRGRKSQSAAVQDAKGTLRLWQPQASRTLSQEDARAIVENLVGFFHVLAEWDAQERSSESVDNNNAALEPGARPGACLRASRS